MDPSRTPNDASGPGRLRRIDAWFAVRYLQLGLKDVDLAVL